MRERVPWAEPDALVGVSVEVPALRLASTVGLVELRAFCAERAVLYTYPATGVPGRDPGGSAAAMWQLLSSRWL